MQIDAAVMLMDIGIELHRGMRLRAPALPFERYVYITSRRAIVVEPEAGQGSLNKYQLYVRLREIMEICSVIVGSPEWQEARHLRHALFFEVHGLPFSVMDDRHEANAVHIVVKECDRVVGYGRLAELERGRFEISQMAVHPAHQRKGIGKALLATLLERAGQAGAVEATLNARVGAVAFYERAGFMKSGDIFLSKTTGTPHVLMKRNLNRERQGYFGSG